MEVHFMILILTFSITNSFFKCFKIMVKHSIQTGSSSHLSIKITHIFNFFLVEKLLVMALILRSWLFKKKIHMQPPQNCNSSSSALEAHEFISIHSSSTRSNRINLRWPSLGKLSNCQYLLSGDQILLVHLSLHR